MRIAIDSGLYLLVNCFAMYVWFGLARKVVARKVAIFLALAALMSALISAIHIGQLIQKTIGIAVVSPRILYNFTIYLEYASTALYVVGMILIKQSCLIFSRSPSVETGSAS